MLLGIGLLAGIIIGWLAHIDYVKWLAENSALGYIYAYIDGRKKLVLTPLNPKTLRNMK